MLRIGMDNERGYIPDDETLGDAENEYAIRDYWHRQRDYEVWSRHLRWTGRVRNSFRTKMWTSNTENTLAVLGDVSAPDELAGEGPVNRTHRELADRVKHRFMMRSLDWHQEQFECIFQDDSRDSDGVI